MFLGGDRMIGTKKASMGFLQSAAFASLGLVPLLILTSVPAAAQDSRHVRVQFGGGSGWGQTESRNGFAAPLPAGPGYANFNYARNAETSPSEDRLRLKPMNFSGN
jgi:hypothetical protein